MSSQAMPAPWALQPTKTREPVNRERMPGRRGRHGGLPCDPIPGGSGTRLAPARAATPRISPVPPCVLSRGARAGPKRNPRMRSGPDAGGGCPPMGKGQGKRGSVGEGQSPSSGQKNVQVALNESPLATARPGEEIPAGGWMLVPPSAGPGRSPSGRSAVRLSLRLRGTAVWRGLHVLFPWRGVTCAWENWSRESGSGDTSAASRGRGTAPEGDLASRSLGGRSKAPLPSFKLRDVGKG